MMTVALVATLAAAALWRQWRGVEVESAERARVQSVWILNGARDWGRLILAGDLRESPGIDHLGEPWAVPLAEARLSTFLSAGESSSDTDRDAFLSGQITDLQSRLNVMNLVTGDPIQAYSRFEHLFRELGLRTGELATLADNLRRANDAMKADDKTTNDAPLLPRRFEQLAWLGVSPETLQALRPYVTVLPPSGSDPTPVNLNTASALVIYAALPDIGLAGAQQLVAQRDRSPIKDPKQAVAQLLNTQLSSDLEKDVEKWTDVKSSFFEIRGRLRLDDVALEEVAVVLRRSNTPNSRGVITLWRERTALTAGG
jgi:general secretion pathway protein K